MPFNNLPQFANSDAPAQIAYTKLFDYDDDNNLIYEGWAQPALGSTETTDAVWAIRKYTYTSDNRVTAKWANGNTDEINVWDDRGSLTFN